MHVFLYTCNLVREYLNELILFRWNGNGSKKDLQIWEACGGWSLNLQCFNTIFLSACLEVIHVLGGDIPYSLIKSLEISLKLPPLLIIHHSSYILHRVSGLPAFSHHEFAAKTSLTPTISYIHLLAFSTCNRSCTLSGGYFWGIFRSKFRRLAGHVTSRVLGIV